MGYHLGRSVGVFVAACLLMAAGCKAKSEGAGVQKAATAKAVEGEQKPAGPRRGGNVRLPSNEPRDLIPALQTRFDRATPLIFEGLVGLDATFGLKPRLAESWDIAPDNRTITFRLRKGVTWHDGKPFTSKDVKFTYRVIDGAERQTVWKAYFSQVETVETPDDHTVVVNYKEPYALGLVSWTVGIMPAHVYDDDPARVDAPDVKQGIGTGPFEFSRWEKGERIVLDANTEYWGGPPFLDHVELLLNVPAGRRLELLEAGKLDFVEITDVLQWSQEVHTPDFRDRFDVATEVENRLNMIAWNEQREPFDRAAVRRAVAHALDRRRVIQEVLVGQARLMSAPFFPNMPGLNPAVAPLPFDLSRSVRLLDDAGLRAKEGGERFEIELIARDATRDSQTDEMLAIFRKDLRAIGVDLKVVFLDTQSFFDRILLREFDAALLGWLPDIADPDPYALLHSSQINAGVNFAGYANPEVDALLDEARRRTDMDARTGLYEKVHALIQRDAPYTVLYAPYGQYAWSRNLRGVNPRDIGTQPRFPGVSRWWVDPVAR